MSLDDITSLLQSFVNRPLFNRTTITDCRTFTMTVPHRLEIGIGNAPDPGDSTTLMSRAPQDQLGLRLCL